MKKLILLLFIPLVFVCGFSQNEKIEVEITSQQKNPYEIYTERDKDSYIDYSKISTNFNKEISQIVNNKLERKNQLKQISDNIIKFTNSEIKLVESGSINQKILELKAHLNKTIPYLHKWLTDGIFAVNDWELFMLDIPNVVVENLIQLQSLDFKLTDLKNELFDKNGNSSSPLIEEITSDILTQYKIQIVDNGISPEFSKKGKVKKKGRPKNPSIVYIMKNKNYDFDDVYNRVIDSISNTKSLSKNKKKDFETIYSELKKLKELLDLGIITQQEYDSKTAYLKKLLLDN